MALEEIWLRVRRLNRYVEEQAPWRLAKEPGAEDQLSGVLASLVEGLRVVGVLLWPYMPSSMDRLLDALGASSTDLSGAEFGAGAISEVRSLDALFPKDLPVAEA